MPSIQAAHPTYSTPKDHDLTSQTKIAAGIDIDFHSEVNQYEFIKTLGHGSYGKVELACHKVTQEKVIHKKAIKNARQQERLRREIRILSLLHHPHIISLIQVIETAENIYLIMEYASGGELFEYIIQKHDQSVSFSHAINEDAEIKKFFRQIISAIDYCHTHHILHRDLKPENLLLDKDKNIKLIDFGFGNIFGSETEDVNRGCGAPSVIKLLNTFCGSPYYASPEMISGVPYYGPEVDIWSLGVILYTLLMGKLPFDDNNTQELFKKIISGKFYIPPHLSPEAKDLLLGCLNPNAVQRYTMNHILDHPWTSQNGKMSLVNSYIPPRRPIHAENCSMAIFNHLLKSGYSGSEMRNILFDVEKSHPLKSEYYLLLDAVCQKRVSLIEPIQSHHAYVSQGYDGLEHMSSLKQGHKKFSLDVTGKENHTSLQTGDHLNRPTASSHASQLKEVKKSAPSIIQTEHINTSSHVPSVIRAKVEKLLTNCTPYFLSFKGHKVATHAGDNSINKDRSYRLGSQPAVQSHTHHPQSAPGFFRRFSYPIFGKFMSSGSTCSNVKVVPQEIIHASSDEASLVGEKDKDLFSPRVVHEGWQVALSTCLPMQDLQYSIHHTLQCLNILYRMGPQSIHGNPSILSSPYIATCEYQYKTPAFHYILFKDYQGSGSIAKINFELEIVIISPFQKQHTKPPTKDNHVVPPSSTTFGVVVKRITGSYWHFKKLHQSLVLHIQQQLLCVASYSY